jgi:AhpD family alkylhydroperoxidase
MRSRLLTVVVLLALASTLAPPALALNRRPVVRTPSPNSAMATLDDLERIGRTRINATPRVTLADSNSATLKAITLADPLGTSQVPNYLKAMAQQTQGAPKFAEMVRVFLYGGTLAPELKMAMAVRVAQQLNSAYAAAHAMRWLRASERGRAMLVQLRSDKLSALTPAEQLGLAYADALTRGVHEVSDADFQKTRAFYNDSQIVELTMTVCFLNYFTRMSEALNLPVEAWVLDGSASTPSSVVAYQPPVARIALISDDEMGATSVAAAAATEQQKPAAGLGLGMANSQRAMLRAPALAMAWRAYGAAVREKFSIDRGIQLQISFAVSMANDCRYCTLHQVLGLRRLGVDPAKLVAMKKDDSALTPRELTAVTFARKVTREPAAVTDEDFGKLKSEFGEQGAFEVLLQTCGFSFMNRFTDGLRLPSEDEAIRVYKETYGANWQ